jgi:hypothetical protein
LPHIRLCVWARSVVLQRTINLGIRCITIPNAYLKQNHKWNTLSYWSIPTGSARSSLNGRNSNYRFQRWGIRHHNTRDGLTGRTKWSDRPVLNQTTAMVFVPCNNSMAYQTED